MKIAIIGDFNFAYTSHHATNKALQHVEICLEQPLNYYWINSKEVMAFNTDELEQFDAFFVAPGPYQNSFYISNFIGKIQHLGVPAMLTGEAFKLLIDDFIRTQKLDYGDEKMISKNLVVDNKFVSTELHFIHPSLKKIYKNKSFRELTSSRYDIVPEVWRIMEDRGWSVLAKNKSDQVEIIECKKPGFIQATMFCPQINSSSDMPHPLLLNFIKQVQESNQLKSKD